MSGIKRRSHALCHPNTNKTKGSAYEQMLNSDSGQEARDILKEEMSPAGVHPYSKTKCLVDLLKGKLSILKFFLQNAYLSRQ